MFRINNMKLSVMLNLAFLVVIAGGVMVSVFAGIKLSDANDQQKLTSARLDDLHILRTVKDNASLQSKLMLRVLAPFRLLRMPIWLPLMTWSIIRSR